MRRRPRTPPDRDRLLASVETALEQYHRAYRSLRARQVYAPVVVYLVLAAALAVIPWALGAPVGVLLALEGLLAILGVIYYVGGPDDLGETRMFTRQARAVVEASETFRVAVDEFIAAYPLSDLDDDALEAWSDGPVRTTLPAAPRSASSRSARRDPGAAAVWSRRQELGAWLQDQRVALLQEYLTRHGMDSTGRSVTPGGAEATPSGPSW